MDVDMTFVLKIVLAVLMSPVIGLTVGWILKQKPAERQD
jgi:hypothetical protein